MTVGGNGPAAGREQAAATEPDQPTLAQARDLAIEAHLAGQVIALVEGVSDQLALNRLADRIAAAPGEIPQSLVPIPMTGAGNVRQFMEILGPDGLSARLVALCDAGEEPLFRRALSASGIDPPETEAGLNRLGFFVCREDLEDELIRAVGPDAVMRIAEARGELRSFRKMQNQPEWRDRPVERQLRRWLGVSARRKIAYAPLLIDALSVDRIPAPLSGLLAHARKLQRLEPRQTNGG